MVSFPISRKEKKTAVKAIAAENPKIMKIFIYKKEEIIVENIYIHLQITSQTINNFLLEQILL